jgi:hypothetical protein
MESLESRLERLTPEQRREIEDFVDFLLLKNTLRQSPATVPSPSVMLNAPPVFTAEPPPPLQVPPARMPDLINREEPSSPVTGAHTDSAIHEITAGDDRITCDYMDYGRFEQPSSPATEAVKKVKQKIIAREAEDKSRHILDWVD